LKGAISRVQVIKPKRRERNGRARRVRKRENERENEKERRGKYGHMNRTVTIHPSMAMIPLDCLSCRERVLSVRKREKRLHSRGLSLFFL
jgi:hypothetical protein